MKYGILFATVAVLFGALACRNLGWYLLWLWPAASFTTVAAGYLYFGPQVYGKSSRGELSSLAQLVLFPFLVYLWTLWHVLRLVKREPPFHRLTERVLIGRRVLAHELPPDCDHVIDLTCEFSEPSVLRSKSYRCFPILDGFAPSPEELRRWVSEVAMLPGNIFIHCAEGHGRTGLFAAALLVLSGQCASPAQAIEFIRSKREGVRLNARQMATLEALHSAR